jgi:alkylation response protein AidB-like acyl-CoA dehydrogenase
MPDPAEYLRRIDEIAEVVRADAERADRDRRLGDMTVQALVDAGLPRMMVPAELGGGALTFAESFPILEAMARVDGSTGWNLSIWSGSATMAATLIDDAARDEIFGDPGALCSASLNFMNLQARRVDGGYVFGGRATFLSGSSHARWLSLGGWLHEDGKPVFADGAPAVVRGVAPMAAVPVEDTWHVAGMRSTASNDATLDDLFIPDGFMSDPRRTGLPPHDGAVHIPLLSRFGAPLAFVGLGAARGAIDALRDVAGGRVSLGTSSPLRERADVQIDVARAQALVSSGGAFVRQAWDAAMAKVAAGERTTIDDQAMLRLAYVSAAESAASATDLVRRAAGSAGLYESDRIERFWRDAHAVTVHVMVSPRGYERVGRVLLGLDPAPGIL